MKFGLYYNQPPDRLIFLSPKEHIRLHLLGQKLPDSTKEKIAKKLFGRKQTQQTINKRITSITGRKNPVAIQAMRKARLGTHNTKKANEANRRAHIGKQTWLGKHHTDESKRKISLLRKGLRWYNNGVKNIQSKECPEGFVHGMLRGKKH